VSIGPGDASIAGECQCRAANAAGLEAYLVDTVHTRRKLKEPIILSEHETLATRIDFVLLRVSAKGPPESQSILNNAHDRWGRPRAM